MVIRLFFLFVCMASLQAMLQPPALPPDVPPMERLGSAILGDYGADANPLAHSCSEETCLPDPAYRVYELIKALIDEAHGLDADGRVEDNPEKWRALRKVRMAPYTFEYGDLSKFLNYDSYKDMVAHYDTDTDKRFKKNIGRSIFGGVYPSPFFYPEYFPKAIFIYVDNAHQIHYLRRGYDVLELIHPSTITTQDMKDWANIFEKLQARAHLALHYCRDEDVFDDNNEVIGTSFVGAVYQVLAIDGQEVSRLL